MLLKLDVGGAVGQSLWGPGGRTLLYLSVPAERTQSIGLREYTPEDGTDTLVAKTSQFASFGINGDSSVFVGASRSLASPYLLLLLRVARRELTLCEHRSSDAVAVEPVFSPDSQNVFFTSDRKGKRGDLSRPRGEVRGRDTRGVASAEWCLWAWPGTLIWSLRTVLTTIS